MVAIRSTLSLDVPVAANGALIVDQSYLSILTDLANQKFAENAARIDTLRAALQEKWASMGPSQKEIRRAEKRQQRKEAKIQAQAAKKKNATVPRNTGDEEEGEEEDRASPVAALFVDAESEGM